MRAWKITKINKQGVQSDPFTVTREHHISIFILFSHLKYNNFRINLLNTVCKIQAGISQVTNIIKILVKLIGKNVPKALEATS